jgi:hypothetical protein
MSQVTAFLHTSLFAFNTSERHLPAGIAAIDGTLIERHAGGIVISTTQLCDQKGRELSSDALTLDIPWAKIDHLHIHAK